MSRLSFLLIFLLFETTLSYVDNVKRFRRYLIGIETVGYEYASGDISGNIILGPSSTPIDFMSLSIPKNTYRTICDSIRGMGVNDYVSHIEFNTRSNNLQFKKLIIDERSHDDKLVSYIKVDILGHSSSVNVFTNDGGIEFRGSTSSIMGADAGSRKLYLDSKGNGKIKISVIRQGTTLEVLPPTNLQSGTQSIFHKRIFLGDVIRISSDVTVKLNKMELGSMFEFDYIDSNRFLEIKPGMTIEITTSVSGILGKGVSYNGVSSNYVVNYDDFDVNFTATYENRKLFRPNGLSAEMNLWVDNGEVDYIYTTNNPLGDFINLANCAEGSQIFDPSINNPCSFGLYSPKSDCMLHDTCLSCIQCIIDMDQEVASDYCHELFKFHCRQSGGLFCDAARAAIEDSTTHGCNPESKPYCLATHMSWMTAWPKAGREDRKSVV